VNWTLLYPELSLAVLALFLIGLDLLPIRKALLALIAILSLLISLSFTLGLWGQPEATALAGMLVVDRFALFFKLFFPAAAILVILASVDYVNNFPRFQGEYYALILLATIGMMFMASTGELVSIYIALELTSISLYVLAGFLKDPKSSEAGLKYLILGAIASAVFLYGVALLFGFTGRTHLLEIARFIRGAELSPGLLLAVVLTAAGLGFKIASVPFQMWVPDVYEGAPTPVTAYLSVASKAAGFAVILRIFYSALGAPAWLSLDWGMLFAVLSAVTMTLGNVMALPQANIKRLLGYSSIAHAGYIMMGLAVMGLAPGDILGRSGVLFYLAAYGLTNLGAFTAIIAISGKTGSDLIADYSGMVRRAPLLALALALCLISLTGFPPTAGFIAKVYIFYAAVRHGLVWLVVLAVLNTVVSAYYYLRVVKAMFLGEAVSEERIPSSGALRLALSLCSLGILFLGIAPAAVIHFAESAVRMLG